MDRTAVLEDQCKLWIQVCEKLTALQESPSNIEGKVAVFQAINNWMMNQEISRQQDARYEKKQQSSDEPPSDKQVKYAEDLGIEIPKNCTKKQLSELIKAKV